jgi:ubiquinone biosynthesis monooxygenase Coq7
MPRKKTAPQKEQKETFAAKDKAVLARMLRVNQAGEYGAKRIYAGQLAVLKRRSEKEGGMSDTACQTLEQMKAQEEEHLAAFNELVAENHVRPTALQPLWHVAGFCLGAATALMGEKAAHACTVAVEEVIDEHYAAQSAFLGKKLSAYPKLKKLIDDFRADENEHRMIALEAGAENAPLYPLLHAFIRAGSKTAIWLAERV